ncbi:MAG: hypothetical protein NW701_16615 [Nitrospira sp.]
MEFYEGLVHSYLTAVRRFLVLPQAEILHNSEGEPWKADVDFVALDFKGEKIYLVEVSSSSDYPAKAVDRLLEENYKNIEPYIKSELLRNQLSSFKVIWWFFIRDRHIPRFQKEACYLAYLKSDGHCEAQSLEQTLDEFKRRLG